MTNIKFFYCGICEKKRHMTRKGLRLHLRNEHMKKSQLTNFKDAKENTKIQPWWKFEVIKCQE